MQNVARTNAQLDGHKQMTKEDGIQVVFIFHKLLIKINVKSKSTHAQIWILHNIVFLSTYKNNTDITFVDCLFSISRSRSNKNIITKKRNANNHIRKK